MILKNNPLVYNVSLVILIIIYSVGLTGFLSSHREIMVQLTPYTLLLSMILILINQAEWDRFLFLFIITMLIGGYLIEVAGVKTGLLFGHYSYDHALGYELLDVPLIIGVNWFVLVFSSGMLSNLFNINRFLRSVIASVLMVIIDFSLEPVAMNYDFWSWENDTVPVQNYVSWFFISLIFQGLFQRLRLKRINRFAVILFIVQWVFLLTISLAGYIS